MQYFDRKLLDNQTVERVETTLDALQEIISNNHTIKEQYRDFYTKAQLELLDYWNDRMTRKTKTRPPLDDIPF
jgi:hypothetical protein